jgi:large subunit ribosomal protein L19
MAEEKQDQPIEAQEAPVSQEAAPTAAPEKKKATAKAAKSTTAPKAAAKSTKKAAAPVVREKKRRESFGDLLFYPEVRTDLPPLAAGDVIKVAYRVIEGGKERTQLFEGTIIALKNRGITKTVTVRKTSFGVAVERILPLNSKLVQSIEVIKHQRVRRAKLYYLRKLSGKAARLKEVR